MFDWLLELLADPSWSYLIIGVLFILCGLGLPIPEELILVTGGYLCFKEQADYVVMASVCVGAILLGDVVPFVLGRLFGPRLLRLRWMRLIINRQRLATFDRWFRRRGDMVILIARFIPGLRVVAFFTGGTMRMKWSRFLTLDMLGILLVAPGVVLLGWHFGDKIDKALEWVQTVEDSILYTVLGAAVVLGLWYGLRRRSRKRLAAGPRETFVEPTKPPTDAADPLEVDVAPALESSVTAPESDRAAGGKPGDKTPTATSDGGIGEPT